MFSKVHKVISLLTDTLIFNACLDNTVEVSFITCKGLNSLSR